ncbi:MAG: hypothetical protein AAFR96_03050 [Planctomycetota bacterium]
MATDATTIDALMEAASERLLATSYFDAARLCRRAISIACKQRDWDRAARIAMPLMEARRQIRQIAVDAGIVRIIDTPAQLRRKPEPGCYLFQPPLIGAEARSFRLDAEKRRVPVFVLTREPMTADGRWPVVGVSSMSVRTKLAPPPGVEPHPDGPTRDRISDGISMRWFEAAAEALGDAAIESVDRSDPAVFQVEDTIERLEAVPEHEKLHQLLEATARQADREPPPSAPRRRRMGHPFSF